MSGTSENVSKHRKKRKEIICRVMGGKCAICGYNKCLAALEMHHLNPEEKEYSMATGYCRSLEKDLEEAKKCVLLCSNCHKEVHAGLHNSMELISSYNEKIGIEELRKMQLKENQYIKKEKKCSICNKIIKRSKTGLCVKCAQERKNNINKPNRDELKYLIRNFSFSKIGEQYGINGNSIRKWCDKYNLPRTKKDIKNISDDDWKLL